MKENICFTCRVVIVNDIMAARAKTFVFKRYNVSNYCPLLITKIFLSVYNDRRSDGEQKE